MKTKKIVLIILLFYFIFPFLNGQEINEIIFKNKKNSSEEIKYTQIYNNPSYLPKYYFNLTSGLLNFYNPIKEKGSYTIGLHGGIILNKKLSLDAKITTLIPEGIISLNEEYHGSPLYKTNFQSDINFHYNLIVKIKEKFKKEVLKEMTQDKTTIKYIGKVPHRYADNFALDFGINKINYYDGSRILFLEGPTDYYKVIQVANLSLVSAKIGVSYLRTESRKFKTNFIRGEKAKVKRLYCFATYLFNHNYEVVSFDYYKKNYEYLTKDIKKENSSSYQTIDKNPIGFRLGFENKYFHSGKPNFCTTFGLELGYIPSIQFIPNSNRLNTLILAHIGFGLFNKIVEK
jgi:hypothetical protein